MESFTYPIPFKNCLTWIKNTWIKYNLQFTKPPVILYKTPTHLANHSAKKNRPNPPTPEPLPQP